MDTMQIDTRSERYRLIEEALEEGKKYSRPPQTCSGPT
jgi:hypothetical protein